ncbi:mannose-6-phosphate isomerase, class I [Brachybacterium paraconglomeratum]|uniref:mannose-6-phosphate isomerase, class I n=1 Tax=Brachybacterium paraconglomeratum TaxID=173362 RepID=UPI00223B3928|nr:mannose-6-phosphate isomerase, class I [Brachybacterium paraconglomeratum]MCT1436756.1 mannose-6-phosphate isomerase, class I [Brachybacterium paraconglomeratum]
MWELDGALQHYAWGSTDALPEFLGREADGTPWAEVWFGAHPVAPSLLPAGRALDEAIAAEPRRMLGDGVSRAFAQRLPYLLKVIAPERPLSLQVHPGREHAAESFAAENAAGLPLDSPQRRYRDANHKPEMLVALTRFEALCGFRTPRRAATLLEGLGTELTDRLHELLVQQPTAHGMRAAFRSLVSASMRPGPEAVRGVVEACRHRLGAGESPSPRIDRCVVHLAEHHPGDPGVVAALLLNPVSLQPGEALYVPAGTLHSYLHGVGLEIMAASDNVLRAGLTPKLVDADEMLQCVSVQAAPPLRVAPERQSAASVAYYAPVDDFELSITTLEGSLGEHRLPLRVPGGGPRILLGLEGEVLLESGLGRHVLGAGRALFVPASAGELRAGGAGRFAQASVP